MIASSEVASSSRWRRGRSGATFPGRASSTASGGWWLHEGSSTASSRS